MRQSLALALEPKRSNVRAENYRVPFFGTRVSTSNAGPVLNLNPAEHISQVYEVGFEEWAGRSEFVSLVAFISERVDSESTV